MSELIAHITCYEPLKVPDEEESEFDVVETDGKRSSDCVFLDQSNLQCTVYPEEDFPPREKPICLFSSLLTDKSSEQTLIKRLAYDDPEYGFIIDTINQTVTRNGEEPQPINHVLVKMYEILLDNMGNSVSYSDIHEAARGRTGDFSRPLVIKRMSRLRELIDPDKKIIQAVRGNRYFPAGYKLVPPKEIERNPR